MVLCSNLSNLTLYDDALITPLGLMPFRSYSLWVWCWQVVRRLIVLLPMPLGIYRCVTRSVNTSKKSCSYCARLTHIQFAGLTHKNPFDQLCPRRQGIPSQSV
jgi:hypothetical protein